MNPAVATHVKLLAADFHTLKPNPTTSDLLLLHPHTGAPLRRVEVVGVVVARDHKGRYLRFSLDDGTGCFPCVLWLDHPRVAAPSDLPALAAAAAGFDSRARLGALVRVRGRPGVFRGELQVTVGDVTAEPDPNAELFHWLLCIKLAGERRKTTGRGGFGLDRR